MNERIYIRRLVNTYLSFFKYITHLNLKSVYK